MAKQSLYNFLGKNLYNYNLLVQSKHPLNFHSFHNYFLHFEELIFCSDFAKLFSLFLFLVKLGALLFSFVYLFPKDESYL